VAGGLIGEFVRFLQIARGSSSELEYHLLVARDLAFLSPTEHLQLEKKVAEVQRMLTSLVSAIEQNRTGPAVKTKAASASLGASS
jgi:four helix bundle protein